MDERMQLEAVVRAIQLAIAPVFLVTGVVALFLPAFLGVKLELLVGWLFISAMAVLIAALLIFLNEVFLATSRLRIGASAQRSASGGDQGSSSTSKRPPHTAGLHE